MKKKKHFLKSIQQYIIYFIYNFEFLYVIEKRTFYSSKPTLAEKYLYMSYFCIFFFTVTRQRRLMHII